MAILKILISGPPGAGKSTAIRAISEVAPVNTDVANTDPDLAKELTTAGLDYGELTLDCGQRLLLYGTPGQERFDFMWRILARGALGIIILLDSRRSDLPADLDMYLGALRQPGARTACVVALTHSEQAAPDLERLSLHLQTRDLLCPVVTSDVRQREAVIALMDLLLLQLESTIAGAVDPAPGTGAQVA